MRKPFRSRFVSGGCGLALAGFLGCATPAVVFVSPDYHTQAIRRVALLGFDDFPGQAGSGAIVADVFEKYLLTGPYQLVERSQAEPILQQQGLSLSQAGGVSQAAALGKALGVDALVLGSISELTDTSEQTVMVDIPQEETEPVYQSVLVQGRHGLRDVTEQTGTQTVYNDQSVPETETLPARVGFNARMVSARNGELLWSGSGSADGMDISSAAEYASAKVIQALQKELGTTH